MARKRNPKIDCVHFWVLDKNSFGRCRNCSATKQFPVEENLALRPNEVLTFQNLSSDSRWDSSAWLNAKVHIEFEEWI
jgi:hypothetical protein